MDFLEKKIFYYLRGRGLDTSRQPVLNSSMGNEVSCFFREPDNLYHFYADDGVEYESLDFVFNNGLLAETKFFKILIKEWFNLLKVSGNLVVRFKENKIINGDNVNALFRNLISDCGEILYIKKDESGFFTLIVQKINSVLMDNDGIDRWSFCIINPKGLDIRPLISSIESQNIPHYEILVDSGAPKEVLARQPVRVIEYGDSARLTSVKKNKMLLSARYENVAIIDRDKADMILSENWYSETVRYGSYFEALSPALITQNGERCADWWTLGCAKESIAEKVFQISKLGLLEYRDWNDWVYFPDSVCILKKRLYQKVLWDRHSKEGDENTLFSHHLHHKGILLRMNPRLIFRVNNSPPEILARNFPVFEFDSAVLGKRKGKFWRRTMWVIVEVLLKIDKVNKVVTSVVKSIKSTSLYRIFVR